MPRPVVGTTHFHFTPNHRMEPTYPMKPLPLVFTLLLSLFLLACGGNAPVPLPTPTTPSIAVAPTATAIPPTATTPPTATATATPIPTDTPEPTATATPEPTATPTATPDPYAGYSIESLRLETYGNEGEIQVLETMGQPGNFTRYHIKFPSDGILVDGFMNVPIGEGTFPVIILNHGYMPRQSYDLLTYTTKYADALANAGYLVIHPSFRNHRGSEEGANPHRIGYARDVMHLIPMARRLSQADGNPVGLWGHSMGGGVTLRVLTLSDQVAAAVVYGSMSADEAKNYEAIQGWRREDQNDEPNTDLPFAPTETELYRVLSPINYFNYITAPVAIHHGVLDDQVPYEWSEELAAKFTEAGVTYEFFPYESQNHNFTGDGYALLNQRVIEFFDRYMR
jgi:dienelactone hydrolase